MRNFSLTLLACLLACVSSHAVSGVRGYRVVFIDLTPSQSYKQTFLRYRETANLQQLSSCWSARKGDWIDVAYVKSQPILISREQIKSAAAGDSASIRRFSDLLRKYRDDEISSGFDGAYIVTKKKDQVVVVGLSIDGHWVQHPLPKAQGIQTLDRAVCISAAAFDKSFSP
jgi:hypothetical protein